MKRTLKSGVVLDDEAGEAPKLQAYAHELGMTTLRVYRADDGKQQVYLVVDGERPIFEDAEAPYVQDWLDARAEAIKIRDGAPE